MSNTAMDFEEMRDLYQQVILDHGRQPRNHRRMERFSATARGDNPMCGDRCQIWLAYDGARIADVSFEARGCAISVASGSLMTEVVRGRSAPDARQLFAQFRDMVRSGACPVCADEALERLVPLAGVHEYPSRIKCATLAWHALAAALDGQGSASSE